MAALCMPVSMDTAVGQAGRAGFVLCWGAGRLEGVIWHMQAATLGACGERGRGQGGHVLRRPLPRLRRHPPVRDVFSLKPSTLGSV